MSVEVMDMIPYSPTTWTPEQAKYHEALDLDTAMHQASCLAGGWYRRPVRIDCIVKDADEFYSLRPAELPVPTHWRAVYTIAAHNDDGSVRQ